MHDSIENEIDIAKRIFDSRHETLSTHPVLLNQLKRYQTCIEHTKKVMRDIKMISGCTECANKTGSCCFQQVEQSYDHAMLLVNLLMGVRLPDEREIDGNCYFLGRNGCKLLARDAFCINYICADLKRVLGPSTVSGFAATAGEEIFSGWETERTLRQCLATLVEVGDT